MRFSRTRLTDVLHRVHSAFSRQGPEGLSVGGEEADLAVGDAVLLTERTHRCLGMPQAGPRHGGEQVMLDLVVEAAESEVGEPSPADVTGSDDLAAEEVELLILS